MNKENSAPNRRKSKRRQAKHETLVYNDDFFGQLVDISKGGLAFAYLKNQSRPRDMFFDLNIYCNNHDIHIKDLRCRIVSESSLPQHIVESDGQIQRQSIQFGKLSEQQQSQLMQFIEKADRKQENDSMDIQQ